MSKVDSAIALGILGAFGALGYWLYKKDIFNFNDEETPSIPLNATELAGTTNWRISTSDTTTNEAGDTLVTNVVEGLNKWKDFSFKSTDINPIPMEIPEASGDTIIGYTSQGFPIWETVTREGITSTPAKVKSSSSKTIPYIPRTEQKITVSQPPRDEGGFSALDRIIQERKGLSDTEARAYLL